MGNLHFGGSDGLGRTDFREYPSLGGCGGL